jgi:hypothetical protein
MLQPRLMFHAYIVTPCCKEPTLAVPARDQVQRPVAARFDERARLTPLRGVAATEEHPYRASDVNDPFSETS